MSHLVTIQTKVHDLAAVRQACARLGLPAPTQGTAQLFGAEASGIVVQFPQWRYPAVIDLTSGDIRYDLYSGAWGELRHLHRFLQRYAAERVQLEARRKGYQVREQALQDGSIRMQILETA